MSSETNLASLLMHSDNLVQTPSFKILATGPFAPDHIITTYNPDSRLLLSPSMRHRIDVEWEKAKKDKPNMTAGPLLRLETINADQQGNLILGLGYTDYREYKGMLALSEGERREACYNLSHPLAASLMIFAPAAYRGLGGILVSQRSSQLAHRANALEFPGGNVDAEDLDPISGRINPIATAIREVEEEQGIKNQELENPQLLGIIYENFGDAAPTAIITANIKPGIDINELTRRRGDSEGRQIWLPNSPRELVKFILNNSIMALPHVQAGLYLYLQNNNPVLAEFILRRSRRRGEIYSNRLTPQQIEIIEARKKTNLQI